MCFFIGNKIVIKLRKKQIMASAVNVMWMNTREKARFNMLMAHAIREVEWKKRNWTTIIHHINIYMTHTILFQHFNSTIFEFIFRIYQFGPIFSILTWNIFDCCHQAFKCRIVKNKQTKQNHIPTPIRIKILTFVASIEVVWNVYCIYTLF